MSRKSRKLQLRALVGRLDDLGAGNLALYIGKYHKIQNLQMEFCFFDLMSLDFVKKSFGYLSLATRGVTNVDCVKQNCANYISCTDYICSR